jgi:hypothetical protein
MRNGKEKSRQTGARSSHLQAYREMEALKHAGSWWPDVMASKRKSNLDSVSVLLCVSSVSEEWENAQKQFAHGRIRSRLCVEFV